MMRMIVMVPVEFRVLLDRPRPGVYKVFEQLIR